MVSLALLRQQPDAGSDAVVVVDVFAELNEVSGEELDALCLHPVDALPVDERAVGAAEVADEAPARRTPVSASRDA